ncbi:hypothetical protein ABH920_001953 [Catenulispora sp. EB89]
MVNTASHICTQQVAVRKAADVFGLRAARPTATADDVVDGPCRDARAVRPGVRCVRREDCERVSGAKGSGHSGGVAVEIAEQDDRTCRGGRELGQASQLTGPAVAGAHVRGDYEHVAGPDGQQALARIVVEGFGSDLVRWLVRDQNQVLAWVH